MPSASFVINIRFISVSLWPLGAVSAFARHQREASRGEAPARLHGDQIGANLRSQSSVPIAAETRTEQQNAVEQGRGAFEGTEEDLIWFDEEPPGDVYAEALVRTVMTNGQYCSVHAARADE
jgi:hypothetical protein